MNCLECHRAGAEREAIVLCHHCLSGLCDAHLHEVSEPVLVREPICKTVALPKRAWFFLCETCGTAFDQLFDRGLRLARGKDAAALALSA